jgi:HlyD family secretion protein
VGVAVVGTVVATYVYRADRAPERPAVTTAAVTRGDVVATIEATGTLQAVTTVQVGTQVSGTIKALHADFNSTVRRGQVVAELDPSLFQTQVEQARATIVRLEAEARRADVQSEDARLKLRRARELSERRLIPAADLETAETNARLADAAVQSAAAQITQARAALNQSQVNLAHTVIRAPIDGIVISRNVDVGQTVAASMQAPTLFVIAQDLARMQVNANVAEADIGRIAAGQAAQFRVDAYPGRTFGGVVSRVRLDPIVQQNVVSYVTTIDVPNAGLLLKPGMTANVSIEVERADGVLRVPTAALRVRPTDEVLAAYGASGEGATGAPAEAGRGPGTPRPSSAAAASPRTGGGAGGPRASAVWVLEDQRLRRVSVQTGPADATHTAVVGGALAEGAAVVTAIAAPAATSTSTSRSPLLPGRPGAGGRTGGGRTP